jgi:hypothetical protein
MNYTLSNMLGRRMALDSFSPLDLSPSLWLSDTGSNPAQWDDLSGNARHAVQATGSNQPSIVAAAINGHQVRRFDGVDDVMAIPENIIGNSSNKSIFAVATIQGLEFGGIITSKIVSTDTSPAVAVNASRAIECFNTASEVTSSAARTLNVPFYVSYVKGGSVLSSWINGGSPITSAAVGTVIPATMTSIGTYRTTGDTNFGKLDIAEILVFPTSLSAADRQRVERYLSQKYALPI